MNKELFYFFHSIIERNPSVSPVVFFFAEIFPYIIILSAIIFILFQNKYKHEDGLVRIINKCYELILFSVTVLSSWGIVVCLKMIFKIPRPFVFLPTVTPLFYPTDFSFPSGHSAFFSALAGALFIRHKKVGLLFFLFALCIGISRIIAGVHYPFDILAGLILGFSLALVSNFLIKKYFNYLVKDNS